MDSSSAWRSEPFATLVESVSDCSALPPHDHSGAVTFDRSRGYVADWVALESDADDQQAAVTEAPARS